MNSNICVEMSDKSSYLYGMNNPIKLNKYLFYSYLG